MNLPMFNVSNLRWTISVYSHFPVFVETGNEIRVENDWNGWNGMKKVEWIMNGKNEQTEKFSFELKKAEKK